MDRLRRFLILVLTNSFQFRAILFCALWSWHMGKRCRLYERSLRRDGPRRYSMISREVSHTFTRYRLYEENDTNCKDNLRMDRNCFLRLCYVLEVNAGLSDGGHVCIKEQVAIFLSVLAHHKKNRSVRFDFYRSGETISKYFNIVLRAVLSLHKQLLCTPHSYDPLTDDDKWLPFEHCLGAIDGTFIKVHVPKKDKPRYRNRKSEIAVNVFAACNQDTNFTHVLTGWEGSAADSRVLKDAIRRPNGFVVPVGKYYLADNDYTNGEGFLVSFRSVRYHLHEWGVGQPPPQNYKEYFNMKHCKARNTIERAFGLLKMRWAILRSHCFYTIQGQNRVILACCLLHNFIRLNMHRDPLEDVLLPEDPNAGLVFDDPPPDLIEVVEPSEEWTAYREALAQQMWADYTNSA